MSKQLIVFKLLGLGALDAYHWNEEKLKGHIYKGYLSESPVPGFYHTKCRRTTDNERFLFCRAQVEILKTGELT